MSKDSQVSHYIMNSLPNCRLKIGDLEFDCLPALLGVLQNLLPKHHHPDGACTQRAEHIRTCTDSDFPRIDAEDLPFEKGEILVIIKQSDTQWWSARNKDSGLGCFPAPSLKGQPAESPTVL